MMDEKARGVPYHFVCKGYHSNKDEPPSLKTASYCSIHQCIFVLKIALECSICQYRSVL